MFGLGNSSPGLSEGKHQTAPRANQQLLPVAGRVPGAASFLCHVGIFLSRSQKASCFLFPQACLFVSFFLLGLGWVGSRAGLGWLVASLLGPERLAF